MKAPLSISHLKRVVAATVLTLIFAGLPGSGEAQPVREFYKINCTSCHKLGGGRLIGPDLKGVLERKDREWLTEFIMNPKAKIDAQDEYALKLLKEANGIIMVTVPIDRTRAEELLDLIEAESKLDTSEFAGLTVPLVPFTDSDVAHGVELFTGGVRLKSGAPPCLSCHSTNGSGAALGGNLGPDLTQVFERLMGREALTAWLSAPPTATMQSVFKPHPLEDEELHALVALFDNTAKSVPDGGGIMLWMGVIFYGVGGTLVVLMAFGGFWSGRFRAVRRPLVNSAKLKNVKKHNLQKSKSGKLGGNS
jgi:cytochrome c2